MRSHIIPVGESRLIVSLLEGIGRISVTIDNGKGGGNTILLPALEGAETSVVLTACVKALGR